MGSYDAAVKVILSRCRQAALEYFLVLEVVESEVMEWPQETASLRRSDFPIRVRTPGGTSFSCAFGSAEPLGARPSSTAFGIRRPVSAENGPVGPTRHITPDS